MPAKPRHVERSSFLKLIVKGFDKERIALSLNIVGVIFARILSAGYFFVITGMISRILPHPVLTTLLTLVVATSVVPFIQLGLGSSVVRAITRDDHWELSAEVGSILATVRITAVLGIVGFGCASAFSFGSPHTSLLMLLASLSSLAALTQSAEWVLTGLKQNRAIAAIYAVTTLAAIAGSTIFPPKGIESSFFYIYTPPIISSFLVFIIALTTSQKFRVASRARILPELPYVSRALGPGLLFTISAALLNTMPQGLTIAPSEMSSAGLPLLRMILSITTILAAAVMPIVVQIASKRDDRPLSERTVGWALASYVLAAVTFTYVAAPFVLRIWLGPSGSTLNHTDQLYGALLAGVWVPSSFLLQREFISGSRWLAAISLATGAVAAIIGWTFNHYIFALFTPLSLQLLAVLMSVIPQLGIHFVTARRSSL